MENDTKREYREGEEGKYQRGKERRELRECLLKIELGVRES